MILQSLVPGGLDPDLELLAQGSGHRRERRSGSRSRGRSRGRSRQRRQEVPSSTGAMEQCFSRHRSHDLGVELIFGVGIKLNGQVGTQNLAS